MATILASRTVCSAVSCRSASVVSEASSGSQSVRSLAYRTNIRGLSLRLTGNATNKRALHTTSASYQQEPSTGDATAKAEQLLEDVKAKWDKVEDKPTFILYIGAGVTATYLASAIIGAFDAVPLLPKIFQLIGIGYSSWFVYRYLLFTPNRQELYQKIDEVKAKIAGDGNSSATKSVAADVKPIGKE